MDTAHEPGRTTTTTPRKSAADKHGFFEAEYLLALMDTVEPHEHDFPKSEWPFSDLENVVAISTVQVFRQGFPILRVSHD